jgi:hypothetical protein
MFLFLFVLVLTATLILVISLALGVIGGSTVGPLALISKLCKVNKIALAILTIIFYPITIIVSVVLAFGFLFLTISKKFVYYRAINTFYAIK